MVQRLPQELAVGKDMTDPAFQDTEFVGVVGRLGAVQATARSWT
jgi:hypothetical protein